VKKVTRMSGASRGWRGDQAPKLTLGAVSAPGVVARNGTIGFAP
jgi:hypothetical protein